MSGRVRDAFIRHGHDAWSCDILPNDTGPHIQDDVLNVVNCGWDMALFFPDCTYLTVSGLFRNKNNPERAAKTEKALVFVGKLLASDIKKIVLENPVGCISTRIRKPDQTIQPYHFGEDASKRTCLWLEGVPLLRPTGFCEPRIAKDGKQRWGNQTDSGQNRLGPSADRAMLRSLTYPGIADAMGEQWGGSLDA